MPIQYEMDFPHTRHLLDTLPDWLAQLSQSCGKPVPKERNAGVQYRFAEQSPEVLQTAKAVRMVSGLRAAMHLADLGHTVEAGSLLRMVTDFANEILAVGEGLERGKFTAPQQKFIDDFFEPLPATLDEFLDNEAQSHVGRKDLYKAHKRLAQDARQDPGSPGGREKSDIFYRLGHEFADQSGHNKSDDDQPS